MWGSKKKISRNINSLIGRETKILGDMDFTGGLLIDGKIIGNVTANDDNTAMITINKDGYVQGEIQIPNVLVNGSVEGSIYASHHIELAKDARIHGNVYYNLIEMAIGAEVNGKLVHVTEDSVVEAIETNNEPARLENTEKNSEI